MEKQAGQILQWPIHRVTTVERRLSDYRGGTSTISVLPNLPDHRGSFRKKNCRHTLIQRFCCRNLQHKGLLMFFVDIQGLVLGLNTSTNRYKFRSVFLHRLWRNDRNVVLGMIFITQRKFARRPHRYKGHLFLVFRTLWHYYLVSFNFYINVLIAKWIRFSKSFFLAKVRGVSCLGVRRRINAVLQLFRASVRLLSNIGYRCGQFLVLGKGIVVNRYIVFNRYRAKISYIIIHVWQFSVHSNCNRSNQVCVQVEHFRSARL